MIISASRRTDIPAFYSKWFMKRIEEGWFYSINPFNPSQKKRISLLPEDVDVIVFWSKNPEPLSIYLEELDRKGYRYYFQFTLNDYPDFLEPGVPALKVRLETFKKLADRLGSGRVVWRYDPVIISNVTPVEYHIERFEYIAGCLSGKSDRVVISFLDFYEKLAGRWDMLRQTEDFLPYDITLPENSDELGRLVSAMSGIAAEAGLGIFTCSEQADLSGYGVNHGSCIDNALINELFHTNLKAARDRNQRPGCLCAASVDMGRYNCCGHLCGYCYANLNERLVKRNTAVHNVETPFLY